MSADIHRTSQARRAVFLDRDGVINRSEKPVNKPGDLQIFDFVPDALMLLSSLGYRLMVVTNQGGIGAGYFTERDLEDIHSHMKNVFSRSGITIDQTYYSSYFGTSAKTHFLLGAKRRKPEAGMVIQAAIDFDLDLDSCWFVGDSEDDIRTAAAAGVKSCLVLSGRTSSRDDLKLSRPDITTKNLLEFANFLSEQEHDECNTSGCPSGKTSDCPGDQKSSNTKAGN